VEKVKSFDEFLGKTVSGVEEKGLLTLMSIHEHLPPQARRELKAVGWTKGLELAKIARREGRPSIVQPGCTRPARCPRSSLSRKWRRKLTGKETEPWEIIYFKLYKSQIPIIEQAIETAALMLGTGKSRGYCLEMICADFLAGATWTTEIRRCCCTR